MSPNPPATTGPPPPSARPRPGRARRVRTLGVSALLSATAGTLAVSLAAMPLLLETLRGTIIPTLAFLSVIGMIVAAALGVASLGTTIAWLLLYLDPPTTPASATAPADPGPGPPAVAGRSRTLVRVGLASLFVTSSVITLTALVTDAAAFLRHAISLRYLFGLVAVGMALNAAASQAESGPNRATLPPSRPPPGGDR